MNFAFGSIVQRSCKNFANHFNCTGKARRRGSMLLEEELNAVVNQNNNSNKNNVGAKDGSGGKIGMENNVSVRKTSI